MGGHVNPMKPLLNRGRNVILKHCQGVPQSKELSATAKQRYCQELSKKTLLPGSITIKNTATECLQRVSQTKFQQWSATNKMIAR